MVSSARARPPLFIRVNDFVLGLLLGIATVSLLLLILLGILCLPILWTALQEAPGVPEPTPLLVRHEAPLTTPPIARRLS